MESVFLLRLTKEEKAALFSFAKKHGASASQIVRQLIRGSVTPDAPRLVSNRTGRPKVPTAVPGQKS
jgi:hypothetical protein